MASTDNLTSFDPWLFWSTTAGNSLSDNSSLYDVLTAVVNTSNNKPSLSPNPDTPRGSGSGSEPETAVSKRSGPGPSTSGRVGKRKPRASKKNPTTYITADASNFRQMVQQVTGVKFPPTGQIPTSFSAQILKPEPQRFAGASFNGRIQGCLPTLDTSAFLLGLGGGDVASQAVAPVDVGNQGVLGFDGFSCFPTLDSWKAL